MLSLDEGMLLKEISIIKTVLHVKRENNTEPLDETSAILKTFITGIENMVDHKVKVIRCDNRTKFKNKEMNQFYEMKGIMRQYSVARTPQQNSIAERRNKTLIEAARTMLADSKLPTTFWAEAVNTAYHIEKFDVKADEGFFIRYSLNSKAFRVFNNKTRIVEENLHIRFSENTLNIAGSRPNWLFDIDALTKLMNYKPVVVGNLSNGNACIKACDDAGKARKETVPGKDYILLPLWTVDEDLRQESECKDQEKEDNVNCTNNVNVAGTNRVNVVGANINNELPFDPQMPALEDISTFNFSSDHEDHDEMADMNNFNMTIQVSPTLTTRIHNDHLIDQVIEDLHSTTQTRNMSKNLEEHGFVATINQRTNHKDLQNYLFPCFLSQKEPKIVIHALKDPSWIEAMQDELLQFKLQEV
uniref:Retroviral polymerase SH3-like domain-containing protein n=1 Tax=Tanacetum cinerariifolium TaxID=118510 RepID=A0A6L2M5D0_TANCI|nr:hypothetical protein [Tanacetum cinerariifolium]